MKFSALRWMSGAVLYALATLVVAQPSGASRPEIVPSHAFSDAELSALPVENWITNGGNSYNQRYSPLTQINRFNVKDLKALWKTGMGSGDQYKNGGHAQILHYKGTLFVANGVNLKTCSAFTVTTSIVPCGMRLQLCSPVMAALSMDRASTAGRNGNVNSWAPGVRRVCMRAG